MPLTLQLNQLQQTVTPENTLSLETASRLGSGFVVMDIMGLKDATCNMANSQTALQK